MKFFWLGVILVALCLVCEVLSDYSESMLPTKEIRNRVHRTMRVNMRVGKRFGESEYEDEVEKRDFLNPNRRLRLVFRPGKRNFGNPELVEPNGDGNNQNSHITAPKRRLRMILRTGKRNAGTKDTQFTLIPQTQFDPDSNIEDILPEPITNTDYKRSFPQFLLNPRIGKLDKTWKIRPLENLQKRSDPKATDLWFGPRIGRSNDDQFENIPWNYVILNGNRPSNLPVLKSNDVEKEPNEELTE